MLNEYLTQIDKDAQDKEYSRQMAEFQHRKQKLKEKSNQYAEAKYWLDEFKTHIHTGDCMNTDDTMIMRSMVEKIIAFDGRIDI